MFLSGRSDPVEISAHPIANLRDRNKFFHLKPQVGSETSRRDRKFRRETKTAHICGCRQTCGRNSLTNLDRQVIAPVAAASCLSR